jgi:thiamine pyrophosphate-dependent acetolactate synthase large subunit-like protein
MQVYEAMARALKAEGCEDVFGLMGDGNLLLWTAMARAGLRIVSVRHEATAVGMADGYFRATGRPGIATVTAGPGVTNVATSLTIAARANSALVLLAGEVGRTMRHHNQTMNQRQFADNCGARFHLLTSPSNLAAELAEAFFEARHRSCPVLLSMPMDLQEDAVPDAWSYTPSVSALPDMPIHPAPEAVDVLAQALMGAQRPVFIAGRGAMRARARTEIVALAERAGALLSTTLPAKGLFDGCAEDIGIAGGWSNRPAQQLLGEADFVLGVGAELGHYTSQDGKLFPRAAVARIDVKPAPAEIGAKPGLYVRGDARVTASRVLQRLAETGFRQEGFRTAQTRAVLTHVPPASPSPSDGLDPRKLASAIGAALPEGALITCGGGHAMAFLAMYLRLPPAGEISFTYEFGAIGCGLQIGMGMTLANRRRPHLVIEGDGSLMMALQELETVARSGMSSVVLVWNDAGFGAEAHKLRAWGLDAGLARWPSPDYVAIAKALGGGGVRLENEQEVGAAIGLGLQKGGLFVIDAPVSPSALSDPFAQAYFGEENRAPRLRAEMPQSG